MRKPRVCGSFFSGSPSECRDKVDVFYERARGKRANGRKEIPLLCFVLFGKPALGPRDCLSTRKANEDADEAKNMK
jgi:hypothetical protein